MDIDNLGMTAAELRAAANTPEVHAASIEAATDFIIEHHSEELEDFASEELASTIAMHAAVLTRFYLSALGDPNLLQKIRDAREEEEEEGYEY